jgi:predicted RNA binding protein YcfA (HicA-like mRNA interferase family)
MAYRNSSNDPWISRLPNSPLPAISGAELVAALKAAGFNETRVHGSHHRLKNDKTGRATTVPVHAGKDVPKGTLRTILRDTGLSAEQLRKLL